MNAILRWFYKPVYRCKPVAKHYGYIADTEDKLYRYNLDESFSVTPLKGYYMLELQAGDENRPSLLHLHVTYKKNDHERSIYSLLVKPGVNSKRVVHFPASVENLYLTCASEIVALTDIQLKFVPLNLTYAKKHIEKKLHNNRLFADIDTVNTSGTKDVSWDSYNQLFNESDSSVTYQAWIKNKEPSLFNSAVIESDIRISIIVPVFNSKPMWLSELVESVLNQTYSNWQLILVDDASTSIATLNSLKSIEQLDPRINVVKRAYNGHICKATNEGINQAKGDYVLFLDHDDLLSPYALNELASEIKKYPQAKLVYSDEDLMTEKGVRVNPHFKPDWNLDLLLSHNYITHLACYERSFLNDLNGMRIGFEGAQDYDLALRASKVLQPEEVRHIPKVLYHWRMVEGSTACDASNKSYATRAGLKAVQDYLDSTGENAKACHDLQDNFYKIKRALPSQDLTPIVSIIIPTRNGLDVLKPCIDSLINTTQYQKLELVIVDNGTDDLDALEYLKYVKNVYSIKSQGKPFTVKVIEDYGDFNFSRLINAGVNAASGEVLLLLNNDTQAIHIGWLQEMLSHALRKDIGCVGAKLLYPDDTIQHAGVILGLGGYAAHSHRGLSRYAGGYFCRAQVVQNLSAVTAACLMVRRDVFDKVDGFDENFEVAYNDVDFCLRVQAAGYRNLYTPFAELYHYESKTRGQDTCEIKKARFDAEKARLAARWQDVIKHDPAYNPNLTRGSEKFSIGS
ncbi:MAG: glycosyltransferase family 2 protein [Oceanospirillaceae bacterium]|nr:glycosyltransferase family 2 protein [Oceanospirillaceae bacterium]